MTPHRETPSFDVLAVGEVDVSRPDHAIDMPRSQSGANPQHLIVTLLGDYWSRCTEHLPSAALVALASEFGITSTSARAALSRLARRGLLESSKSGRRTSYGLTPRAARVLNEGFARIVDFGLHHGPWNGSWSVVIFSVPEDQRDVRHTLRNQLRWLGFAPLYDGVWVSPRADVQQTARVLERFGVASATLLVSHVAHAINDGEPLSAWDIDSLRESYMQFVDRFGPLLDRIDAGDVGLAEALVERTRVMDVWRQFPNLDPELPEDVLGEAWPRDDARAIFARVYDALGPLAEMRFRQVLAEHDQLLAERACHRTTASEGAPPSARR